MPRPKHPDAPPAKLPDGKKNPAYTKWWSQQDSVVQKKNTDEYKARRKAWVKKWNESEKGMAARARYIGKPSTKVRVTIRHRTAFPTGSKTCVSCKQVFHYDDVLARGWKLVGKFYCICDLCS